MIIYESLFIRKGFFTLISASFPVHKREDSITFPYFRNLRRINGVLTDSNSKTNFSGGVMTTPQATTNDRREIFGWAMYDWANSAFSTTVGTVFLGPYIASLAADSAKVSQDGLARFFGIPVAPDSFLPYCISFSVGLQVLFLPILGAIADYSHLRKRMMQIFATIGAVATIAMFFVVGDLWWLGGLLFIIANLAFGAA